MRRSLLLLQLLGWLPVWALYTMLLGPANPVHRLSLPEAAFRGLFAIGTAALLGLLVQRLTLALPWPYPFRVRFLLLHVAAAALYSFIWVVLSGFILQGVRPVPQGIVVVHLFFVPSFVLGVWLYVMVAGVSYATQATARAAQAEALAASSQLAALRGQLNPHFLFNALHTVVQLIPREPARAAEAAEQVAGLLRRTVEEDRDLVPLAEEWAFVERYLELERVRFGDRLLVTASIAESAADALVPCFALQTLVENAVRHGAAPRVEPTTIAVRATLSHGNLELEVKDNGAGTDSGDLDKPAGTGLARLRERLRALYGTAARLELATTPGAGFTATLLLPQPESA